MRLRPRAASVAVVVALLFGGCFLHRKGRLLDGQQGGGGASGGTGGVGAASSGNGGGGATGGGSSSSSSSSSSTSSSGGGAAPVVFCSDSNCLPGQVCCLEVATNDAVGCASPGGCATDEWELSCDGASDCATTELCCAFHYLLTFSAVECAATCNGGFGEEVLCGGDTRPIPCPDDCISLPQLDYDYYFCSPL